MGTTRAARLEAGNSIFTEPVIVERRQEGCVRFSYLPHDSLTPRRYRCQPDTALRELREAVGAEFDSDAGPLLRARLHPIFSAENFNPPAYARLSRVTAPEIRGGAEDGSEMGAYSFLKQAQREANLRGALRDYLRFGREPAILFVT